MFTRTKILISTMVFLISFVLLLAFFGEHGMVIHRSMKDESSALQLSVEKKQEELMLMRKEKEAVLDDDVEGEYLLVFDSDSYKPVEMADTDVDRGASFLPDWACFVIALALAIGYLCIAYIVGSLKR